MNPIELSIHIRYDEISSIKEMKTIQLTKNLRLVSMTDDNGPFALLMAHTGDHIHYTIQIESEDELRAAIESFQEKPVGAFN